MRCRYPQVVSGFGLLTRYTFDEEPVGEVGCAAVGCGTLLQDVPNIARLRPYDSARLLGSETPKPLVPLRARSANRCAPTCSSGATRKLLFNNKHSGLLSRASALGRAVMAGRRSPHSFEGAPTMAMEPPKGEASEERKPTFDPPSKVTTSAGRARMSRHRFWHAQHPERTAGEVFVSLAYN